MHITLKDDVANDGTPINPATRTEMNRVLGLLADTANIHAANAALLEFRAYEKLPKDAVNRAFESFEVFNRMATARLPGFTLWETLPGRKEELRLQRGSGAGFEALDNDRQVYYRYAKLMSLQAIAQAQFAFYLSHLL